MVSAQYKKLKDYLVIEVKEGDIGTGSKEEVREFIESSPEGEEMAEKKKQNYLIEKCSEVEGLFDALYEGSNQEVI